MLCHKRLFNKRIFVKYFSYSLLTKFLHQFYFSNDRLLVGLSENEEFKVNVISRQHQFLDPKRESNFFRKKLPRIFLSQKLVAKISY